MPSAAGSHLALLLTDIKRVLRDLVLNARLKWDSAWSDIPAADKTKLFQVVSAISHSCLVTDHQVFPILGQRPTSILETICKRLGDRGDCQTVHEKQTKKSLQEWLAACSRKV